MRRGGARTSNINLNKISPNVVELCLFIVNLHVQDTEEKKAEHKMCYKLTFSTSFDVLLTVLHLSIFISVINQLDAQNFVLQ